MGSNAVLAGLRVYFGQHDKTLIDRNRQDDPSNIFATGLPTEDRAFYRMVMEGVASEIIRKAMRDNERLRQIRAEAERQGQWAMRACGARRSPFGAARASLRIERVAI
jgi:hypothetical protein